MNKILLILFTVLCLTGCATKTKIEKVEVPVYSCPEPIIPAMPDLAVYKITAQSKDQAVLKAYGQTVDQLILHIQSLTTQLKTYQGK